MPFSTFNEFGAALCEAAGVAFPSPLPDPNNVMAFHLVLDGVIVNLIHHELEGNDDAFVLVVFGVTPEHDECEVLRVLAEMNFVLMSADAPVLCCNPDTREVVLRKALSISLVDAELAFSAIKQLVAMALEWRADPLFALAGSRGAGFPFHQRI